jgi:hypothetical protein
MRSCAFTNCEVVFAKDQPEYLPLPASVHINGLVTTRWHFGWRERLAILFGTNLYLQVHTFRAPLQPVKLTIGEPLK